MLIITHKLFLYKNYKIIHSTRKISTSLLLNSLKNNNNLLKKVNHSSYSPVTATAISDATKNPNPLFVHDNRLDASGCCVYENIISPDEHDVLIQYIGNKMKRKRYERAHWDSVITGYKEVELLSSLQNTPEIEEIIVNIQTLLSKNHLSAGDHHQWLPCHAIDLEKKGILSAHVDSVRFSGDIVSGLSLKSSAIMRLKQEQENSEKKSGKDDSSYIDLYLPPRSLYVLSGKCRYEYTHELLPTSEFLSRKMSDIGLDPIQVEREQRLSVIFRDTKKN